MYKEALNLLRIEQGLTFKDETLGNINFSVINNKLLPEKNIPDENFMTLADIPQRQGALVKPRIILRVILPLHFLLLSPCPLM